MKTTRTLPGEKTTLRFAVVTKLCTLGQLASYALQRKAAMPKQWVPPLKALDKFASFGIDAEHVLDFEQVHLGVTCFVLAFVNEENCSKAEIGRVSSTNPTRVSL